MFLKFDSYSRRFGATFHLWYIFMKRKKHKTYIYILLWKETKDVLEIFYIVNVDVETSLCGFLSKIGLVGCLLCRLLTLFVVILPVKNSVSSQNCISFFPTFVNMKMNIFNLERQEKKWKLIPILKDFYLSVIQPRVMSRFLLSEQYINHVYLRNEIVFGF